MGQDVGGHVLMADLAALPHMLIAGATARARRSA
jgi:DNA segregation ATPase FtsK/SpoIIIE-like protein